MTLKQQATEYLSQRYSEQCEKYPHTRDQVSRELYIARNIRAAMNNARAREAQS